MMDAIKSECLSTGRYFASKFQPANIRCAWVVIVDDSGPLFSGTADSLDIGIGEAMDSLAVQHHSWFFVLGTADGRYFSGRNDFNQIQSREYAETVYPEHVAEIRQLLA